MANAIKYQQRIHEAFANELAKDAPSSEEYYAELQKKILEEHPEAAALLKMPKSMKTQLSPELAAIADSNEELCKYFYCSTNAPFSDKAKSSANAYSSAFSSADTVKAYYDTLKATRMLLEEENDKDFRKVHKRIIDALETYFSLCAESVLSEYYGKQYTDFVKKFTKTEEEHQTVQKIKRDATIKAKKEAAQD